MANENNHNMIVGLDIGTSKVVALVAEVTPDGELNIVGIGTHPTRGLTKGVVINIESTVQSVQHAIEEAQLWLTAIFTRCFSALRVVISVARTPMAPWRFVIVKSVVLI